jgi:hypothetical protein
MNTGFSYAHPIESVFESSRSRKVNICIKSTSERTKYSEKQKEHRVTISCSEQRPQIRGTYVVYNHINNNTNADHDPLSSCVKLCHYSVFEHHANRAAIHNTSSAGWQATWHVIFGKLIRIFRCVWSTWTFVTKHHSQVKVRQRLDDANSWQ